METKIKKFWKYFYDNKGIKLFEELLFNLKYKDNKNDSAFVIIAPNVEDVADTYNILKTQSDWCSKLNGNYFTPNQKLMEYVFSRSVICNTREEVSHSYLYNSYFVHIPDLVELSTISTLLECSESNIGLKIGGEPTLYAIDNIETLRALGCICIKIQNQDFPYNNGSHILYGYHTSEATPRLSCKRAKIVTRDDPESHADELKYEMYILPFRKATELDDFSFNGYVIEGQLVYNSSTGEYFISQTDTDNTRSFCFRVIENPLQIPENSEELALGTLVLHDFFVITMSNEDINEMLNDPYLFIFGLLIGYNILLERSNNGKDIYNFEILNCIIFPFILFEDYMGGISGDEELNFCANIRNYLLYCNMYVNKNEYSAESDNITSKLYKAYNILSLKCETVNGVNIASVITEDSNGKYISINELYKGII